MATLECWLIGIRSRYHTQSQYPGTESVLLIMTNTRLGSNNYTFSLFLILGRGLIIQREQSNQVATRCGLIKYQLLLGDVHTEQEQTSMHVFCPSIAIYWIQTWAGYSNIGKDILTNGRKKYVMNEGQYSISRWPWCDVLSMNAFCKNKKNKAWFAVHNLLF